MKNNFGLIGAVEGAVGGDDPVAENASDPAQDRSARPGHPPENGVGVDHGGVAPGQQATPAASTQHLAVPSFCLWNSSRHRSSSRMDSGGSSVRRRDRAPASSMRSIPLSGRKR